MVIDAIHPFQTNKITINKTVIKPVLIHTVHGGGDAVRQPLAARYHRRAKFADLLALCLRRGGGEVAKHEDWEQEFEDFGHFLLSG